MAKTFYFNGQPVEVGYSHARWHVGRGEKTAERRRLDEALVEVLGGRPENRRALMTLIVDVLEWALFKDPQPV